MHRVPSCQPNLWFGHQHLLHLLETGTSDTRFLVLADTISPPLRQPEIMHLSYCGNRRALNVHVFGDKNNRVVSMKTYFYCCY